MLISPFEDSPIKMVFVEVAAEDIDRLIFLQEWGHDTIHVHPVVEYQDGLLRFQHKTAMVDISQRHRCSISQSLSSLMILGVALPANTNTFFPLR